MARQPRDNDIGDVLVDRCSLPVGVAAHPGRSGNGFRPFLVPPDWIGASHTAHRATPDSRSRDADGHLALRCTQDGLRGLPHVQLHQCGPLGRHGVSRRRRGRPGRGTS
jgi:hypothetical protein